MGIIKNKKNNVGGNFYVLGLEWIGIPARILFIMDSLHKVAVQSFKILVMSWLF
jgi:hypothetical protein